MLTSLHIENIAVIERCDIDFSKGFHVLTGETGAGKSIIIDSLSAVLGERTSRDLVRTGADKARVSATFELLNKNVTEWLTENGYLDEEEEELLVSREISVDGKNICRINGRPASVSILKELGPQLINIHGQHDSQQLLDSTMHSVFIDRYASTDEYIKEFTEYTENYSLLNQLKAQARKLDINEEEKERKLDMLKYQIQEIEQAQLKPGEDEEIAQRRTILHNSTKLMQTLEHINMLMQGDDNSIGILSALGDAENSAYASRNTLSEMEEIQSAIAQLKYSAMDVAENVRDLRDKADFSPQEIEEIETRFDLITKLKRKYGNSIDDILSFLDNAKDELNKIEFCEQSIIDITNKINALNKTARENAQKLYDIRVGCARDFENRVANELESLDMGKVTFSVEIRKREDLDSRGIDDIEFFVSTNLGEPLKPLGKIASGGEMARIMLAIKNVLAEHDDVATLIFDEVDAGVSGRAAQRVAEKLGKLSRCKQVLCVTHLAQISAMADVHYCISKNERDGRTYTTVDVLDDDGRIEEIARITGGTQITETTRENARELLMTARGIKKEF